MPMFAMFKITTSFKIILLVIFLSFLIDGHNVNGNLVNGNLVNGNLVNDQLVRDQHV